MRAVILEGGFGPAPPLPQTDPQRRATEILETRGLSRARLTLLEQKKNVTFRVDEGADPAEGRYLLRLCDPAGYSPAEIASEAAWLRSLREEAGIAAPEPVAAPDGSFVAVGSGGDRHGILFRWIPGVTLDSSISPETLVRLGELLGRMHSFGGSFEPPSGFSRPRYDTARILGDPNVLPADWDGPLLTRRDRDLLAEAARTVRSVLDGLGEDPAIFGMIHTDPEPDNMVWHEGEIYPIDFADCGWGYYLYDLAAALLPLGEKRDLTPLRQALLEGYLRTHPLPPGHVDLLDTFLIVRGLFAVRWMLVEGWWREAVRVYATTAVPNILAEVRRYLDSRGGASPGDGGPALARLNTVRFLAHLRSLGIQLAAEGERLRMRAPKGVLTPALQEEIAARKPEILAALRRGATAASVPPLVRVSAAGQGCPLSYSQLQIWFLDQLDPGNPSYNIPQAVQMTGPLRPDLLARSLGEIVRRQASLRTTFAAGPEEPEQLVAPGLDVPIPVIDLRALPSAAREAEGVLLTREEARHPFCLSTGPLLRFTLLRLADEEHRALVTAHHIISDGQSGGVLIRELGTVYEAMMRGEPSPLPEPPVQYTDYAHWQRQWLQGERLAERLAYWREQLRDLPAVFDLPSDRPRPSQPTSRGGRLDVEIPTRLTARLSELGRAENATLFMGLLAGFATLLDRLSGRSDIVVGSPIANRARAETEGLIGFFVNTLVLRIAVDGQAPFRSLLERVLRTTQEAYAHQDLPFEKLVEELRPERSLSHTPLFQILFNFQSVQLPELRLGGLLLRWLPARSGVEKFELNLGLRETREGVTIALSYKRDLFDSPTIGRLAGHYLALLEQAVSAPDRPLHELPLLSAAEHHQVLEWNDTAEVFAGEPCLHELILAQATRTPEALAVVDENAAVTYRELARRSGWLAARLRRIGVGPDVLVGLCVERSVEMVVGILGILRAGGAYVPLDPAYPPARLEYMLEDAGARVLLTAGDTAERLPGEGRTVVRLDLADWDAGGEAPDAEPGERPGPASLAYVIYTSGSTGQPKGAMNPHEAVRNRLLWTQRTFGLTPEDRILQKTPFSFDVSVWELLWPLMVGARLVMARPGGHLDPVYLIDLIDREGITTLHFVPPMLGVFLEQEGLERCRTLRRVLASGEALPAELERRFYERMGWAALFNLYGPTEAAIDVSWWPCAPEERSSVPIGRPVANVWLTVLDAATRPVPLGVAGELHIGGIALARGYWRRPALTAERFVPDPVSGEAGARLYRTGDLARFRPGGEIEYLGRIDHQVKLRGFRIELGEIEATLRSHPRVRDGVVLVREDLPGSPMLVGYLVTGAEGAPEPAELREYLAEKLPEYMVPSAFVCLDELPLSPNGKVDRKALPAPERTRAATGGADAPTDPVEELLAGIWAEVLGLDGVGVNDDFFTLGGHSLLATQVASRLRGAFGVELPLRALFEAPTVAGLARLVRAARTGGAAPPPSLVAVPRTGDLPLSFAQQRLWFIDQLEPGSPAYNIPLALRLTGALDPNVLARTFAEVVRRHEGLRTTFAVRGGEPVQEIAPLLELPLPVLDLSALPDEEREARLREALGEEARRPFDLGRGPLLRLTLWRLGEHDHALGVTLHHIVSDGWSLGVLLREVAALFGAFTQGLPSPLPELPVQYADFAVWQRRWLQGEVLREQLAFWRQELAGAPRVLDLPVDHPHPTVRGSRSGSARIGLGSPLSQAVRDLCRRERVTPFMALLSAWSLLLGRHAGQDDVLTGTPVAGRNRREIEALIGFFVNTLVLRADLSGGPSFRDLLARMRRAALDAFAHQDLPFERLVEELVPERSLAVTPLFQTVFLLQNAPVGRLEVPGLVLAPLAVERGVAKFDLTLALAEGAEGFAGVLDHAADLFDSPTIERLAGHYLALLEQAVSAPDRPLHELPLLSAAEHHQVLEWNDTAEAFAGEPCLHELILAQATRTPEALAVVDENAAVTYRELARRSGWLAAHLRRLGVGPDVLAGLCVERSVEMVVGILGILRAGGAYVPLDPAYPLARLEYMLEDAGARVLLTTGDAADRLPGEGRTVVRLDLADWDEGGEAPDAEPGERPGPASLAYVIYTSGSTGQPKGAMNTHEAVRNRLLWARVFGLTPEDRLLQKTPFSFDVSVWELLWPLIEGARLVMARPGGHLDPVYLIDVIAREGITTLHFVPPMLGVFLEQEGLERCRTLRRVLASGEALPAELERRFHERMGWAALFNLYGPTEAAIEVSWWPCAPGGERSSVPIGRPVANVWLTVLDAATRPVPLGVAGELHIGGIAPARGYWRRPALTAERFVPDPVSGEAGARLYRTGDLTRFRPGGEIEYLGRIDHQVKVRGFRIEPVEIEAALATHQDIRECMVLARPDAGGDTRLVAYVVPAEGASSAPGAGEMREHLRTVLPEHMVPSAFVVLPELPLTPNGKVDRRALPEPTRAAAAPGSGAPVTPTEEILAAIWTEVLEVERVGRDDHFFERGGHSLRATQVVARLREALGIALPVRRLFEAPTLAALAEAVDAERQVGGPPLVPVPRHGALPLSFAQQRLWFLDRLVPDSPAYNIPAAVRLAGPLDPTLLRRVLAFLVARHETLRTRFPAVDGEPAQVIAPDLDLPLPVVDLSGLPAIRREGEARRLARAEGRRPFDLAAMPLVRLTLLRTESVEHIALLSMHHIVSDGWSMGVLLEELTAAYTAFSRDEKPALPPLPVQYADFAVWQRQAFTGERLREELGWWRSRLAGVPACLPLPIDHPRPAVQTWRGGAWRLALSPTASTGLAALARRERSTLFMTLLAGFGTLLGRITGVDDLTVGSPIAGRERPQLERLIGFFVNTLVLRMDLAGAPTLRELLAAVRQTCLEAYAHQDLPFEYLVEELAPARDLSLSPLFQVAFALQNAPRRSLALPEIAAVPLLQESTTAKFDLTLTLEERDGALAGVLEYRTDLFDASTVAHLGRSLGSLLATMATSPETRISDLPLLDPLQRQQVLVEWSRTGPDPEDLRPVPARVAQWARTTPGARALTSASGDMTYGDLLASARRLAWHLRAQGVGPESLVAVLLERSVTEVVVLLAVLEAGGAYLPLDPAHPRERLAFQVADAGACVLISTDTLAPGLVAALGSTVPRLVLLERDAAALAARPVEPLPEQAGPENLAYVIYTSGSTGTPKGVAVEHRALSNLVAWHERAFAVTPEDRGTRLSGLSFDASVWELWPYLATGASVAVPPDEIRIAPAALRDWLLAEQVTLCFVPTPLAEALLGMDWPDHARLRQVLTGGDALHRHPPAGLPWGLVNNYGPTETTVVATSGPVPPDGPSGRAPSIGRPIAGDRVYLLDRSLAPVPAGAPGEICIGGAGVARGYLGRPEQTAERFVPDPWSPGRGARLYRSGDLARHRADGTLEFLGRLDDQVKIRGFRIEPGEIAAVLAGHPGVRESAILPQEGPGGEPQLVAWVVPTGDEPPAERELRDFLRERLPAYMVPSAFGFLPALPLTANGKLDRRALPALLGGPQDIAGGDRPRDLLELRLAQIWEELLGSGPIGLRDDFFERGGHSLLALRLVAEIRARLGREIPVATLFGGATVERVAAVLRTENGPARREILVPIRSGGSRPPLLIVHPVGGNVLCYADLVRRLGPDQPVWGLQSPGPEEHPRDLAALADSYVDAVLRAFPAGPLHLAGWSLGAAVAFEMARQLAEGGRPAERLLLLDPPATDGGRGGPPDPEVVEALFARDLERLTGQTTAGEGASRELFALFRDNFLALRGYTPSAYAGRAVVFRTAGRGEEVDPLPGWHRLVADGLEVEDVPGDHWSLLREPHVETLAERVAARLEEGA
jgi:amino acid adenylation domain-containing protein